MEFVADSLFNGRRIRALTVVDNYSRECLAITVDHSLRSDDVVATMEYIKTMRGLPARIQVDNGSEFISKALDLWAYENDVIWTPQDPENPRTIHISSPSTTASDTSA
jgi:putative transposase